MCKRHSWHKTPVYGSHGPRHVTSQDARPGWGMAGRLKDHQDPALTAEGQPQPGGAAAQQTGWKSHRSPTNEGEKLLPPNRLSSFSRPALPRTRAMLQQRSPRHCRAEPHSPQPWAQHHSPGLLSARRERDHEAAATSDVVLRCTPRIRHDSQQDKPGWDTDEPAVPLAERVAQRGKGPELHPTTQWNSLLQDDQLN